MSQPHRPVRGRFFPQVEPLECRLTPSITLRFDYSYDTSGFFNNPERREALERAADQITPHLHDNLTAITPGGSNTWTASFYNAVSGTMTSIPNLRVGADEIIVYVGAAPIGGVELGLASAGGFSASGTQDWLDTIRGRGQSGALSNPKTDYATWGGMVTFNSTSNWNFNAEPPAASQYDFESVALHELMHIFGFGLGEPAFTRHISGGMFTGPAVSAANGGPVRVVGSPPDHWAPGTMGGGLASPMVPAIMRGEERALTAIDYAALDDIGWELSATPRTTGGSNSPTVNVPAPVLDPVDFVVGTGIGAVPAGYEYNRNGQPIRTVQPVDTSASGGLRVARADINGDGVTDTVYGTGPGVTTLVTVVDGKSGGTLFSFSPFESSYTGGVNLSAGDLTGDGKAEIVVSPDEGGGPRVQVYDGGTARLLADLYGIDDPNFRGGVRTAVGDINGDGRADLVVAAGSGGGPRVAVYDGPSILAGSPVKITGDFFAFEPELRNGAYVTVADLDGDGYGEIIAGAGPGGAPRVIAFSGRHLTAFQYHEIVNVFVSDTNARGGVRLASTDVNQDGVPDLITGSGPGGRGKVQVFAASTLLSGAAKPWLSLQDELWVESGVFVG